MANNYEKILQNDIVNAYFLESDGKKHSDRAIGLSFAFNKNEIEKTVDAKKGETLKKKCGEIEEAAKEIIVSVIKFIGITAGTNFGRLTGDFERNSNDFTIFNSRYGLEVDLWLVFPEGGTPVLNVKYDLDEGKRIFQKFNNSFDEPRTEGFIANLKNKARQLVNGCKAFKS